MATFYFLQGTKPLVKRYDLDANNANQIRKTSYLNNFLFTSHAVPCTTLVDLHAALVAHAAKGHCLIKGQLTRDLVSESRKDSHDPNGATEWVCLDLDGAPFATVEDYIASEPALKDVSYVLQHSASAGLPGTTGIRAHVFMLLSHKFTAPWLKFWLKHLNLSNDAVRKSMVLSATDNALSWPIDITTCQEDKLLYIAHPILGPGVTSTIKPAQRIIYVKKKLDRLPIERIHCPKADAINADERTQVASLRKAAKLPVIRNKIKIEGEYEIQPGMGALRMTQCWTDGDWQRFNINDGDSAAYYHPIDNFELIHNFKGESSYYTKEIFPDYYKQCVAKRKALSAAPTDNGDVLLAICDLATGAYHKVHWESEAYRLNLYPARSEKQLADFMVNHGKFMDDVVPQWDVVFDPHSDTIIDHDEKRINVYVPSQYYRTERDEAAHLGLCPVIDSIMRHAVSNGEHNAVYEHWLNWLACIVQFRVKTTTAWVLSGVSSTGKGLISHIMMQLLGRDYVQSRDFDVMEDTFNSWMERALIVVLEETQVEASPRMKMLTGKLKHLISEPTAPMRAMHSVSRQVENYTNFIFTSNYRNPVFIDPSDDRYNFGDYQTQSILQTFPTYTRDFLTKHIAEELDHFFQYLMHRKAHVHAAGLIVENQTRKTVMENSSNSVDDVANALLTGDMEFFAQDLPDMDMQLRINGEHAGALIAYDEIIRAEMRQLVTQGTAGVRGGKTPVMAFTSKLTRDELNVIFQINVRNTSTSASTFARMLGHHNIHIKPIRKNNKSVRGIEVRWEATKDWCDEHRATLEIPTPMRRVK